MNSFDVSMKFKGLAGGFGFVIIGIIIIYKELIKILLKPNTLAKFVLLKAS